MGEEICADFKKGVQEVWGSVSEVGEAIPQFLCCEKRVLKAVAVPGAIPLLRSPS